VQPKNENLGELIRTALMYCRDFQGLQNQTKT